MTIFSAAVLLFLVLDPFGNIPFFIAALQNVPRDRHKRVIVRE
ncbi:MAG: MarC family protein, partial [Vicinamibacteria bacterium]